MSIKEKFLTSRAERMAYGGFFVGQNIIFIFVLQYLTMFYTDIVGLAPAAVGTLFLVARVWDAVNDPILGAIVDRSNFKSGKFKPWINAVIVLMPIATIAVFWNVGGGSTSNLVYAYITYILWGMIYTISDVPIFAIATVMTDNIDERVSLISIGRFAAGIAALIAAALGAPIIEALGWTTATIVLMVIAFAVMLPVRFLVRERIVYERKETVNLKSMIQAISSNKYLMIFYLAFIIMGSLNTSSVAGIYFATYNLGSLELFMIISFIGMSPMLVIPVILPALVRKFGKKNIYMTAVILGIVTCVAQYFIGYENFALFLVLSAIKGIGLMIPGTMMGLFSADCVEYGAYVTGRRNEGITFSVQTFSVKLGTAFAGFFGTVLLGYYGYVPNVQQSERALDGLWKMMTIYPAVGLIIAVIIVGLFYKLKESDVRRMIEEMKVKNA
ncbi:glycoside-pentoside-hexuronide (GPH):cation symporter [Vallitalea okinawensis]|uniref:glycoside-pentoside-hexuronide (GPH):cation symporter n=1 Tax=Vallitalea okinawensis TaxID=2078660 RepID=UPI000CFCD4B1|nr:glycoside-pentoside-hexuronide (GPH):cation symporter [Vallitalea okinawensis]